MTFLLAEQNTNVALRFAHYGYILESGRVVMDGPAADLRENPDVKEFYLGMSDEGRKSLPRCAQLPPPQALAELKHRMQTDMSAISTIWKPAATDARRRSGTQPAASRSRARSSMRLAYAGIAARRGPGRSRCRRPWRALPVLRKSDLGAAQAAHPPFGGFTARAAAEFAHVFQSPGPIYEPGGIEP